MTRAAAGLLLLALGACRGVPRDADETRRIAHLVDSLRPHVEASTGLAFKTPPRFAVRTPEQVRAFVERKLAEQYPAGQFALITDAYRLFGLLPEGTDLRALLETLLAQQIAGFYDPDSATLYALAGAEPAAQRLTIAHELVHALQDQYLPLDSILRDKRDADRSGAAQAILEGQANYASIVMLQGRAIADSDAFWDEFKATGDQLLGGGAMGEVPTFIREGLLFPYLDGARFMRWWGRSSFRDTLPYGPRMPASTEQILFPDRYAAGDAPRVLRFTDSLPDAHDDALGEFEIRLLLQELTGTPRAASAVPLGWGGDRFRVERTPDGVALSWFAVWDAPHQRDRFVAAAASALARPRRPGYRATFDTLTIGGLPATRFLTAPAAWSGWTTPPTIRLDK